MKPGTWQRVWRGALIGLFLAITGCANGTTSTHATATPTMGATNTPRPTPTATLPPAVYAPKYLAHGFGCPDDLALDTQSRLIFTDWKDGSINRIAPDGQVSQILTHLPQAEGVIVAPDGTFLFAEQGLDGQHIDQLAQLAPGSSAPTILTTFANTTNLPGTDSITIDPRTGELLVADSPNGIVYHVSRDGKTVTRIAGGFVRPTEALADMAGHIFVADEYGNSVTRIDPDGTHHRLIAVPDPDDLAFDVDGTLLVTVLGDNTLIRLDPQTGRKLATLATNLFEPQGLAVDSGGNLYVTEENANAVIELVRGGGNFAFTAPQRSGITCG